MQEIEGFVRVLWFVGQSGSRSILVLLIKMDVIYIKPNYTSRISYSAIIYIYLQTVDINVESFEIF